jgi:prepilin-type N-terminal cleavage/methylation domain-containing protein
MKQRGYSLIELLIVMATVAVLMAIALPLFQDALLRANTSSLSTDARALYVAVKQYYVDNNSFPSTAGFDTTNFEPLVGLGYYSGRVQTRLVGTQADGYLGTSGEFWLEMTLGVDPSVRFLVSDSNNAPLSGGAYLDGVFLYVDGVQHEIGTTK